MNATQLAKLVGSIVLVNEVADKKPKKKTLIGLQLESGELHGIVADKRNLTELVHHSKIVPQTTVKQKPAVIDSPVIDTATLAKRVRAMNKKTA